MLYPAARPPLGDSAIHVYPNQQSTFVDVDLEHKSSDCYATRKPWCVLIAPQFMGEQFACHDCVFLNQSTLTQSMEDGFSSPYRARPMRLHYPIEQKEHVSLEPRDSTDMTA